MYNNKTKHVSEICSLLFDDAIALIDDKFGRDYALKNPHLLSSVLTAQERIYTTIESKNYTYVTIPESPQS